MRRSSLLCSRQLWQHRSRSSPPWQPLAAATVLIAVVLLLWRPSHPANRTPQIPASSSGGDDRQVAANPLMPQLNGEWDLVWKDQRGVLLRTHCRIRQNGPSFALDLNDAKLLNREARTPIQGAVEGERISFRVHLRDADSIVFIGRMDFGILNGTTSRGFSWMAIRHPS